MNNHVLSLLLASAVAPISVFAEGGIGIADTPGEIDRIDPGVEAVIRMNAADPTYDVWKHIRDDISEGRKPGPINIQRYPGGMPWVGIPTFFNLPVALTPEDLKAGEVEVAILGAEFYNSARVQSYGPTEMRASTKSEIYHAWGSWVIP